MIARDSSVGLQLLYTGPFSFDNDPVHPYNTTGRASISRLVGFSIGCYLKMGLFSNVVNTPKELEESWTLRLNAPSKRMV